MAVQNTLPDPNNRISTDGDDASGSYGPGFSSVQLTSEAPIVTNRSNSGLVFRTRNRYHKWDINIKYNDLTKAEFNVVYPFLLERQATLESFFVELPQYGNSDAGDKNIGASAAAGETELTLSSVTDINIGDLFYVDDPNDDTHVKAYKVTKVDSTNTKVHISPAIQKKIDYLLSGTEKAKFGTPRLRVVVDGASINYTIKSNGLYSFSVKLEESLT